MNSAAYDKEIFGLNHTINSLDVRLQETQQLVVKLNWELSAIRFRLKALEQKECMEEEPVEEKTNVSPLSHKFWCTFKNKDGSDNLAICGSPEGLIKVYEMVRAWGGRDLVIEDRTVYY